MTYGYARCSTNETRQDIQRQVRELQSLGVDEQNIYMEYESGSKENRRQLNLLLSVVTRGDAIVSTEVSRITRSTRQLYEIIELAKEKGLKIVLGSFVVDCTGKSLDPMTEGMLKMMGVFAELERNMIRQRVQSGVDNARANGVRLGRPSITYDTLPNRFIKAYPMYRAGRITVSDLARLTDVTRPTIYRYIRIAKEYDLTAR